MQQIAIQTDKINLDQFLKWAGVVESGGQVKLFIDDGMILVNGVIVQERRKKIYPGDRIEIDGIGSWQVVRE